MNLTERLSRVRPRWFDQAACAKPTRWTLPQRVAEFFPDRHRGASIAKRLCADCPVRQECYEYAVARPELVGIWGGCGPRERQRERARREQEAVA